MFLYVFYPRNLDLLREQCLFSFFLIQFHEVQDHLFIICLSLQTVPTYRCTNAPNYIQDLKQVTFHENIYQWHNFLHFFASVELGIVMGGGEAWNSFSPQEQQPYPCLVSPPSDAGGYKAQAHLIFMVWKGMISMWVASWVPASWVLSLQSTHRLNAMGKRGPDSQEFSLSMKVSFPTYCFIYIRFLHSIRTCGPSMLLTACRDSCMFLQSIAKELGLWACKC